ncbi:hypothetical protein FACS1894186_4340 [Alphaproteobacteria bacterium]|nr:hypothetical protein FACS1894186_4340 [Alphaproteobacteria bacterium]
MAKEGNPVIAHIICPICGAGGQEVEVCKGGAGDCRIACDTCGSSIMLSKRESKKYKVQAGLIKEEVYESGSIRVDTGRRGGEPWEPARVAAAPVAGFAAPVRERSGFGILGFGADE